MNTNTGYSKKTLGDSYVLLSGGGHKTLSEFIGTLSYSNNKITYTKANDSTSYDLVTIPTVPEYDLYVGASNGTSTAALSTNGNVHLILKKGSNYTRYKIKGYTNISVTSTADEIKITGPNLSGYLTSADLSGYLTSLYTTGLYVGATETQENSQTSNGNTYIKLFDDSTRRANIKISGSTNVSVSSNSSGDITITGPDLSGYLNDGSLYVLKAGDTMTGVLHLMSSQYADSYDSGALDLNNSDIYKVNSIKFADLSDTAAEGLQWYRDSTHVDSIWVKSGVIYFTPNRAWNGTGTNYTVYHSGNLPAYPTKASWNYDDVYLKLTGGTLYNTSSDTPLNIKSNGNNAYIAFQKSDGTSIGSIGVKNDNRAYFYDGSSTHKLAYYSEIPSDYLTASDLGSYLTSSDLKTYSAVLTDTNAKTTNVTGGLFYNLLEKTGDGSYSVIKSVKFVGDGTGISVSSDANGVITITNSKPDLNHNVTTSLYLGGSSSTSDVALTTNGNSYLILKEGSSYTRKQIKGYSNISVTNTTSEIKITGPDLSGFLTSSDLEGVNTHYTTGLYVGATETKSNALTTNGNTYIKLFDDDSRRANIKISGSTNVSVASDSSGNITITGPNLSGYLTSSDLSGYLTSSDLKSYSAVLTDTNAKTSDVAGGTYYNLLEKTGSGNYSVVKSIKFVAGTGISLSHTTAGELKITNSSPNSHQSVSNSNPELKWNTTHTIGTVGGTSLQFTVGNNEGTSDFTDGTELLSSYAGDNGFAVSGTGNKVIYRRKASSMYNYIKGKLDSVYQPKGNYLTGHLSLANYVKLDPGANEQTIKSSIGSLSKGVINFYRNTGDHYTFIGFSNGTTETYLGGIGFKSQSDKNIYYKHTNGDYYPILTSNNVSSYIDSRYVLKSGDTMTGDLTMDSGTTTESIIKFVTKRDVSNGTGWAFSPIQVSGNNDSSIFNISIFGTQQDFQYAYFGNNTYDSWSNIRMYPNGNIYSKKYLLKDSTGFLYPAAYDNGSNLWIGATETATLHHRGQTFISSGYNGTSGYGTIRVSVPNATNTDASNYDVLHSGNWSTYIKAFRYYPLTSSSTTDFNFPDSHDCPGGLYYLNNSSMVGTQTNRPVSFGMLLNFECLAGHLQLASTANLNDLRFRSYWWTNNNLSSGFPGYPDWTTILHSGNTYISNGAVTINGSSITPILSNPGSVEQTIQSSIGSLDKGIINLWRSNGNYYTFLGFSNSSSNTYLGGIGFTAQGNTTIYYRNTSGSVFPLLHPDSNGNLTITGSYYANSDIKLKNILSRENYSSNYFATLPIIKFTWNNRNDNRVHLGTIALDIEFDFPELVTKDENGYKSLDYATLGTIGVISLAKEIVELRKEINELKLKLYDNNLYN